MLNVITIMGRLTHDPELRRTNSGKPVASFTLAVDRDYAPDGQERETDFIDCVAWNGTAEFAQKYFTKGSMMVVRGRLQLRSWTDKEGNKRRTAEVLAENLYFGEPRKTQEGSNQTQSQNGYPGSTGGPGGYNQGYGQPAQVGPSYSQQGFGGYQQGSYQGQSYQAPQGHYPVIMDDDPKLPF